jgi:hypothetical protein
MKSRWQHICMARILVHGSVSTMRVRPEGGCSTHAKPKWLTTTRRPSREADTALTCATRSINGAGQSMVLTNLRYGRHREAEGGEDLHSRHCQQVDGAEEARPVAPVRGVEPLVPGLVWIGVDWWIGGLAPHHGLSSRRSWLWLEGAGLGMLMSFPVCPGVWSRSYQPWDS